MKIKFALLSLIAGMSFTQAAYSASYSTTLDWSSNALYTEQAGGTVFGTDILVNDTVNVTHKATGNNYWVNNSSTMWAPIGASNSGDRYGDTTLNFFNNGALVHTGTRLNGLDQYAHIGSTVNSLPINLIFDTVMFSYLLNSTTSSSNIISTSFIDNFTDDLTYKIGVNEVPIPAAAFMFAPALLGFMGLRRRAKNKAV